MLPRLAVALVLLALLPGATRAQERPVPFRIRTGSVSADFRGRWSGADRSSTDAWGEFREWAELSFRGDLFTSGILQLDGTLRPGINQQRQSRGDLADSGSGYFLDGRIGLAVYRGRPLNGEVEFFSVRQDMTSPFGLQSDGTTTGGSARIEFENPYLPVEAFGRVRRYDRGYVNAAGTVRRYARDEFRVGLVARNSKTRVSLLSGQTRDRVSGWDSDVLRGDFSHNLQWGTGSRLRTSASASRLTGSNRAPQNTASWAQSVTLRHAADIWSDYAYGFSWARSPIAGDGNASQWAVSPHWRFRPRSIASVRALGRNRSSEDGFSEQRFRVEGDLGHTESRVLGMAFSGRLAAGYEWIDRTSRFDDRLLDVFDERHLVDDGRRFVLDEKDVDPTSVVVRDADGLLIFERGLDYDLLELGALLEVLVLPTGRIDVGDVVRVDYRYDAGEDSEIDGPVAEYDLSLRSSKVTLYQRGSFRDFDVRGPVDTRGLERSILVTTGTNLNLSVPFGSVGLGLGHRYSDIGGLASNTLYLSGTVSARVGPRLTASLNGSGDFVRGEGTDRDLAQGIFRLEWRPLSALSLGGYASVWTWRQFDEVQNFLGSGLRADWRIGKLELFLRYDRSVRTNGRTNVNDYLVAGISRSL